MGLVDDVHVVITPTNATRLPDGEVDLPGDRESMSSPIAAMMSSELSLRTFRMLVELKDIGFPIEMSAQIRRQDGHEMTLVLKGSSCCRSPACRRRCHPSHAFSASVITPPFPREGAYAANHWVQFLGLAPTFSREFFLIMSQIEVLTSPEPDAVLLPVVRCQAEGQDSPMLSTFSLLNSFTAVLIRFVAHGLRRT